MSLSLLSLAALTALAAPPAQFKLALGSIASVQTTPELTTFVTEHLAEELRAKGFRVTTSGDMAAVLGLERQKQLLGCTDANSSCMAELASALGVDAILTGQFAKLAGTYQLDIKVLSAKDGARLAGWSGAIADDGGILAALREASAALAHQLGLESEVPRGATEVNAQTNIVPPTHPYRARAWIPAAAGAVLLASGIPLFAAGKNDFSTLSGPAPVQIADWKRLQRDGPILEGVGLTGILVGTAGVAAAAALFFWPAHKVELAMSVSPNSVTLSGVFP